MSFRFVRLPGWLAVMATLALGSGADRAAAAPPALVEPAAEFTVLTRGPVHEAFAETVMFDPQPGVIVSQAPPADIEELPPDQRPEGTNVDWIPGYWAWDDDSSDYLWISGTWRALPPERQWIAGYWAGAEGGVQWTSGYWANAAQTEVEYLPEPPASVEAGPNLEAPSPDHSWLPGNWVWYQNRYAWRPGSWTQVDPNWVWVPAHYLWAPRGYVCVDGYWDHAIERRGVLFAPVSFQQATYARRGFSYTPSTVISLGVFANHLFLRPNYGHYYYGDYYGANYATAGYLPSYSFYASRRGYDPIYARQHWDHRQDRGWHGRSQAAYQHRRDHEDARPPRTYVAQQELRRHGLTGGDHERLYAEPLEQYRQSKESLLRFQPVERVDRERYGRQSQEIRTQRSERQQLEARSEQPAAERTGRAVEPQRVRLPRSPFVARTPETAVEGVRPPKRQELPQPDPKVVPTPRPPRDRPLDRPQAGPSDQPRVPPMDRPQAGPSDKPRVVPQDKPMDRPQAGPSDKPRVVPQDKPMDRPQAGPSDKPRVVPQDKPMDRPQAGPSDKPRVVPQDKPMDRPQAGPSDKPRVVPQDKPMDRPQAGPSDKPRVVPQDKPMDRPQAGPSEKPRPAPQAKPQEQPRVKPTAVPTAKPKDAPREKPRAAPQAKPQEQPRVKPTAVPTAKPKDAPREKPRAAPQAKPQEQPRVKPRAAPEARPEKPRSKPTAVAPVPPTAKPARPDAPAGKSKDGDKKKSRSK